MNLRRTASVLLAGALLAAACIAAVLAYRDDMRRAMRLISSGSSVASTPCGSIEYAVRGEGPPILVVHGAGGGFDQGLMLGEELVPRGYRVIAMSRFGYLRTPMPSGASAEMQADAHACLLDSVGVSRAAVIGVSAGGPSAMQFAIRHPARTSALVLVVPLAWYPGEAPEPPSPAMRIALRALERDPAYWAFIRAAPATVTETLLATPREVLAHASAQERERMAILRERILPVSARAEGLRADGAVGATIGPYALEKITAPVLVIGLEDDLFGTYPRARYTAQQIPGAQFVGFPSGGHAWVGRQRQVRDAVMRFLGERMVSTSAYGRTDVRHSAWVQSFEEESRAVR